MNQLQRCFLILMGSMIINSSLHKLHAQTLETTSADQSTISSNSLIPDERIVRYDTGFWLGLYTTYWITDKWGYYGEYHLRRADGLKRMSKLYLRFGAQYRVDKSLNLTLGAVNRYTWSDHPNDPKEETFVPEYRFWEQLVFKVKHFGVKFYHQIRTEQRWKRSIKIADSEYYYYNRFRYKLLGYVPLYGPLAQPGSWFLCFYNEIFMQAGEKVEYNFFEDNRTYGGIAYAFTDALHIHFGFMKSFGQLDAVTFRDNDIVRLSIYNKLNFNDD
jgi:hypothetical protein